MKLPEKQVQHVDRPEVQETFVDSVEGIVLDGTGARIELCVTRMDVPKPPAMPTAKRYTVCRLACTPEFVIDLANKVNGIIGLMEKQGLVKRENPKDPPAMAIN